MYGDQFYHMTQALLPVAIVLRMCFGIWLLANIDKTQEISIFDRVTEKHVLPSFGLLVGTLGYFALRNVVVFVSDLTETPCERWYKSYQERKILPDEDDHEKSA